MMKRTLFLLTMATAVAAMNLEPKRESPPQVNLSLRSKALAACMLLVV